MIDATKPRRSEPKPLRAGRLRTSGPHRNCEFPSDEAEGFHTHANQATCTFLLVVDAAVLAPKGGLCGYRGPHQYADFLLGISSQYTQNQLRPFYGRNKYIGLYVEDSWRVTPNLTLNYGLRWDRIEPWYEKYNNNITFIPGEQSQVFPTAPTGIVYPGDPGVSRTAAPPGNKDFAPRIGLAYSPLVDGDSVLGKILGGSRKTSVRAGFGIFHAAIAGESLGLISDNPPYGYTFQNSSNPLLVTPFIDGDTGNVEGQRFPAQLAPSNVSRSNPDTSIDFSQFEPIGATPGYKVTNAIPYTEEYMLSLQRQIETNTISYTFSKSLDWACGPDGENNVYTNGSGQVINGTRGPCLKSPRRISAMLQTNDASD